MACRSGNPKRMGFQRRVLASHVECSKRSQGDAEAAMRSVIPAHGTNHLRSGSSAPGSKIRFRQGNHEDFYRTLKARVNAYLDTTGNSRYADRTVAAKGILFAGIAIAAYGLILSGRFQPWGMLALANVFGVAALLLSVSVGHDAAHDTLFRNQKLNGLVLFGCFALLGADPYLWRMRHVKSHHAFPNVNGCDIDIDSNIFLRLSPNHRRRCYQRFQHLYAPLIFWLVDIHTVFIQDPHYLLKRSLANLANIRHPIGVYLSFVLCKAVFLSIVFVIPAIILPIPWWQVLVGALLMSFVASCVFVYMLIGTHFAEETAFPEISPDGTIAHGWATHAMITALDWSPHSRLALFIAGGTNCHAAHHLFPNISHAHYIPITEIVIRTAQEYGIRYNVTTLPRMVVSHFRFLKRMAKAEPTGLAEHAARHRERGGTGN
jgi:linoleoyl-CoA desaturase